MNHQAHFVGMVHRLIYRQCICDIQQAPRGMVLYVTACDTHEVSRLEGSVPGLVHSLSFPVCEDHIGLVGLGSLQHPIVFCS